MNKGAIAIITARGGSKRIPRKNIKEFCGKPMIAYSIEAAIKSGIFDEVMVSTDDIEIAEIVKKYGAKVPFFRSEKTSNDYAITADVLVEVIEKYKKNDLEFEHMCCIYPTAPFITPEKLITGFQMLKEANANAVLPIVAFSYPPQRCIILNEAGKTEMLHPEYEKTRSQDLVKQYHDCGQFYWFKVEKFMEKKSLTIDNTVPYILSELEVQDIDNMEDWKLAEMKYRMMENKNY